AEPDHLPAPAAGSSHPAVPVRPDEESGVRRRISPAARRHAEELGVDLAGVTGTGPLETVTLADVDRAATAPSRPEPPRVEAATPAERQALMRQAIAAAMSRSKREIPHYYLSETVPMARAVEWLTTQNAGRPITERVLMAVVQLKAVARALADFPQLNGFFVEGSFRPEPVAHLGVAIALRQGGLVAPALHDVAAKDLPTLMRELADLVARARAASLRSSELSDATITVTNLGDQGVESVFGIITPPQVALVGFGRVAPRPFVTEAGLAAVPTVTASLAADHRVSDGHTGALFLASLHDWLQRPEDL
ncbi:MAG: dihydrolipoamide acetyltransferase family protein, partial [Candidatus Nanopelagicales bacterium]